MAASDVLSISMKINHNFVVLMTALKVKTGNGRLAALT